MKGKYSVSLLRVDRARRVLELDFISTLFGDYECPETINTEFGGKNKPMCGS